MVILVGLRFATRGCLVGGVEGEGVAGVGLLSIGDHIWPDWWARKASAISCAVGRRCFLASGGRETKDRVLLAVRCGESRCCVFTLDG